MNFRIGQKVVCIKDTPYPADAPPPHPMAGTIATVSWIGLHKGFEDEPAIDLVEFPSPETDRYHRGYAASNWRPLVERKTDISIFTKMLNPNQEAVNG
jgi:hypothetical protein